MIYKLVNDRYFRYLEIYLKIDYTFKNFDHFQFSITMIAFILLMVGYTFQSPN